MSGGSQSSRVKVYPLLGLYRIAERLGLAGPADKLASKLDVYIRGSGLRVSPRGYAALVFLSSISSLALAPILLVLTRNPLLSLGASLVISAVAYVLGYSYPMVRYRNRGEMLEIKVIKLEMYMLSAFLSTPSYRDALYKLYERRDLVGFEVELEEAARYMALQRGDAAEALARAASITPSRTTRALLESLRGLLQAGFGLVEYLRWALASHYSQVEARYRAALDSLSMLMEIYMALAVLAPVLTIIGIIALYGIGTSIVKPTINPQLIIGAVAFVVSPAVALWVLITADSIISRLRP
ncbi:MAG: hypothetical protein GSR80_000234 [Desulfurococcales archaeon]|nr:hypothetical protein [Desulfurococcales archaeon]